MQIDKWKGGCFRGAAPLSIDAHCPPTPSYYDKRREGWSEEQPGAGFVALMQMKTEMRRMVRSVFRDTSSTADCHFPCFGVGQAWDCHGVTFCDLKKENPKTLECNSMMCKHKMTFTNTYTSIMTFCIYIVMDERHHCGYSIAHWA